MMKILNTSYLLSNIQNDWPCTVSSVDQHFIDRQSILFSVNLKTGSRAQFIILIMCSIYSFFINLLHLPDKHNNHKTIATWPQLIETQAMIKLHFYQ